MNSFAKNLYSASDRLTSYVLKVCVKPKVDLNLIAFAVCLPYMSFFTPQPFINLIVSALIHGFITTNINTAKNFLLELDFTTIKLLN